MSLCMGWMGFILLGGGLLGSLTLAVPTSMDIEMEGVSFRIANSYVFYARFSQKMIKIVMVERFFRLYSMT